MELSLEFPIRSSVRGWGKVSIRRNVSTGRPFKTPVSELFNNSAEHGRHPLWSFTLPFPPSQEDSAGLGCTKERASASRAWVRKTFWRSVLLSDDQLGAVEWLKVFSFLRICHQMERLDSSHVSSIWWRAPSGEKTKPTGGNILERDCMNHVSTAFSMHLSYH